VLTTKQFAKKRKITEGRVRQLLLERRIKGAERFGKAWAIPEKAVIMPPANPRGGQRKKAATRAR
jgi:hypothetical protein